MVSAQDGPEFQVVFPKIDISNFETRKEQISKELGEAAREIGFFYITGHGISPERLRRAFEFGSKWFDQPTEEKSKYQLDLVEYVGWKGERILHGRDDLPKIEQIIFGHTAKENPYANRLEALAKEAFPGVEEFTQDFLDDLLEVSRTIIKGLAIALGQEEDFFIKGLRRDLPDIAGGGGFNRYHPFTSTSKATEFRIPAHSDAELFTILAQIPGQPGLEVAPGRRFFEVANKGQPFLKNYEKIEHPPADAVKFYPMPPVEGALTVNIGDFLMRYSDGEYLSTYHRVRAPTADNGIPQGSRHVMVYFAQPARSTLVQGPKKRWPAILAGEDTAQMAKKHYEKAQTNPLYGAKVNSGPAENGIQPRTPELVATAER